MIERGKSSYIEISVREARVTFSDLGERVISDVIFLFPRSDFVSGLYSMDGNALTYKPTPQEKLASETRRQVSSDFKVDRKRTNSKAQTRKIKIRQI